MTTTEIANRLVSLCRHGQFAQAYDELYAADILSVEPVGEPREAKGFEAVKAKGDRFEQTMEVHAMEVSDPLVASNYFTITMKMDATDKESGQRMQMDEVCVYQVRDGKISREEFFYPLEG